MKGYKKWGTFALAVGMTMLLSSCVVHRHPRPHHHHPRHHRVALVAEQTTAAEQGKGGLTFEACLAMAEPDSYGSTE